MAIVSPGGIPQSAMIGNEMEVGMPHQYFSSRLSSRSFCSGGATARHARAQEINYPEIGMRKMNFKLSIRVKDFL